MIHCTTPPLINTVQNAKIGGMEQDLKLTSSDYSLALSIFFVVRPLASKHVTCDYSRVNN